MLKQLEDNPRVHGYISPETETRQSKIEGLGLFAKKTIRSGVVVAAWGGRVTTVAEVRKLPKHIGYNYALEFYPGFYLAERSQKELDSSDFINHSCSPNCKIIDTLIMITRRSIKRGEELTTDFSNHTKRGKKFICNCGAKNCKGTIYYD